MNVNCMFEKLKTLTGNLNPLVTDFTKDDC